MYIHYNEGSVFWECNLSGRIIPDKSKGQISGNKRWLELKLKKADQVSWKKLVRMTQSTHANMPPVLHPAYVKWVVFSDT